MEGLSINNIITNEDIVITYTPSVINYSYIVIKNNKYGNRNYISDGSPVSDGYAVKVTP